MLPSPRGTLPLLHERLGRHAPDKPAFSLAFYQGLPPMLGASGFPGAIDWATNANGSIGSGWASSDIATSFSASSTQSAQVQFNLETYHLTRIQTAVPEPSTALLAGAALALIGWLSRR